MTITVGSYSHWRYVAGTGSEVLANIETQVVGPSQIISMNAPSAGSLVVVYHAND